MTIVEAEEIVEEADSDDENTSDEAGSAESIVDESTGEVLKDQET